MSIVGSPGCHIEFLFDIAFNYEARSKIIETIVIFSKRIDTTSEKKTDTIPEIIIDSTAVRVLSTESCLVYIFGRNIIANAHLLVNIFGRSFIVNVSLLLSSRVLSGQMKREAGFI